MSPLRSLASLGVAACLCLALPACTSNVASTEPDAVGETSDPLLVVCKVTLTCCVSNATGIIPWDLTDPFQAQLSAWKCTTPRLYEPNQAANAWWYYSQCVDTAGRVESFLAANPKYQAAPYLAVSSTTLDKNCVTTPPTGSVDVLWDPTCPTCRLTK